MRRWPGTTRPAPETFSAFSSSGQLVAAAYPAGAFARLNVIAPWFRSDAWRHQPRSAAARSAKCCRHKPRSPSPAARQWAEAPHRPSGTRFHPVVELLVHAGQMKPIFEGGDRPPAAHDDGRTLALAHVNQQRIEHTHLNFGNQRRNT